MFYKSICNHIIEKIPLFRNKHEVNTWNRKWLLKLNNHYREFPDCRVKVRRIIKNIIRKSKE